MSSPSGVGPLSGPLFNPDDKKAQKNGGGSGTSKNNWKEARKEYRGDYDTTGDRIFADVEKNIKDGKKDNDTLDVAFGTAYDDYYNGLEKLANKKDGLRERLDKALGVQNGDRSKISSGTHLDLRYVLALDDSDASKPKTVKVDDAAAGRARRGDDIPASDPPKTDGAIIKDVQKEAKEARTIRPGDVASVAKGQQGQTVAKASPDGTVASVAKNKDGDEATSKVDKQGRPQAGAVTNDGKQAAQAGVGQHEVIARAEDKNVGKAGAVVTDKGTTITATQAAASDTETRTITNKEGDVRTVQIDPNSGYAQIAGGAGGKKRMAQIQGVIDQKQQNWAPWDRQVALGDLQQLRTDNPNDWKDITDDQMTDFLNTAASRVGAAQLPTTLNGWKNALTDWSWKSLDDQVSSNGDFLTRWVFGSGATAYDIDKVREEFGN